MDGVATHHLRGKLKEQEGLGSCEEKRDNCGMEMGCTSKVGKDGKERYTCLCSHDMLPPKPKITKDGWTCNRNVVTVVPSPHDFPNLESGHNESHSIESKHLVNEPSPPSPVGIEGWFIVLGVCLLSVFVTSTVCFLKRKSLKRLLQKSQQSKFELDMKSTMNGRLLPDRFIANPTYESATLDLSIRIFSPEEVNMMTQIGQGCFGKVFKGELNGEPIAVKVVKTEHAGEAMKEVETMAAFNHQNILQMIGIAKNSDMEAPWLLFEFMEYGDLASVLRTTANQNIKEPGEVRPQIPIKHDTLLDIAYQISEGMKYLSSQHFVHRDLAARNVLVGNYGVVKISDFGLSRDVYTCDYYKIGGSRLLPVRWMPPESVLYGRFTLESDVWAYGVLLWEIYTWGKQPYFGHSNEEVVQLILDGVLLCPPSDCPPLICQIMAASWKTDPKDRLTFTTICDKYIKSATGRCKENGSEEDKEEESEYEVPNKVPKPWCLESVEVV